MILNNYKSAMAMLLISPDEIKEKLIRLTYNHVTLISRKTKLSRVTVTKFFNRQKIKDENMEKIYDAALEIILARERVIKKRWELIHELGLNVNKDKVK